MRGVRIVDVSGDVKLLISYRIRASIATVLSIPMCIKLGPRFEAVDSLLHLHSVHYYARICFPTIRAQPLLRVLVVKWPRGNDDKGSEQSARKATP
jgi:hypothetical protein